ncbi:MAG TPA: hypothetical protein VN687_13200 [Blastocatellia bacterium]|nr:hypothetical protein [Blastocatellia bacterium]
MEKQELDLDNTATDDLFETVDVETLAKLQGVGPLDFARARRLGKFLPQDESIDDFVRPFAAGVSAVFRKSRSSHQVMMRWALINTPLQRGDPWSADFQFFQRFCHIDETRNR